MWGQQQQQEAATNRCEKEAKEDKEKNPSTANFSNPVEVVVVVVGVVVEALKEDSAAYCTLDCCGRE
jgi:hypothetical protein